MPASRSDRRRPWEPMTLTRHSFGAISKYSGAALNTRAPRPLYDIYLARIAHFREAPPPADWDGVFVYTTK